MLPTLRLRRTTVHQGSRSGLALRLCGAEEATGRICKCVVLDYRTRSREGRFREQHAAQVATYLQAPTQRRMGAGRELFGRRKNATEMPIEIGLNPIRTAEGVFTLASIIDITERKRAEDVEGQMAALVESADDATPMDRHTSQGL